MGKVRVPRGVVTTGGTGRFCMDFFIKGGFSFYTHVSISSVLINILLGARS